MSELSCSNFPQTCNLVTVSESSCGKDNNNVGARMWGSNNVGVVICGEFSWKTAKQSCVCLNFGLLREVLLWAEMKCEVGNGFQEWRRTRDGVFINRKLTESSESGISAFIGDEQHRIYELEWVTSPCESEIWEWMRIARRFFLFLEVLEIIVGRSWNYSKQEYNDEASSDKERSRLSDISLISDTSCMNTACPFCLLCKAHLRLFELGCPDLET